MDCRKFRNNHVAFVDDLLPAFEMEAMQRHVIGGRASTVNWISISEMMPGQRFADQCSLRHTGVIAFVQQPAAD